tara:strand:+ start:109 stop:510 length:402 start_codon:yes stop_codon:yes gene_type:complete
MDAIKQYMQPKWWLIVVGTIFTILGLMTYIDGEGAAETGWGDDYTDNDVFYEKAWASNVLWVAIIALASGLLIEGRALSIVAMAISAGFIISFILQNLANGDLGYGYLELSNAAPGMVAAVGLFLSGYLYLED